MVRHRGASVETVMPHHELDSRGPRNVTSLTAEAVSLFSGSLVGCEKGQSSPEGVAGVLVGVGVVPAADASEHRLGDAVLPGCVPAGFAAVGAVPGVHADHLPPGL